MKRAVAVLLSVLLLTGCAPSADGAYLSTVRENVPALADAADAELTEVGQQVCDMLDDRGFEDGMVEFIRIAKESGLDASEAGTLAGAASAAYCPEHADNF